MMNRTLHAFYFSLTILLLTINSGYAQLPKEKAVAEKWIAGNQEKLKETSQQIWSLSELSLQEEKSSEVLIKLLKENGFKIESGVADMPTAFIASYGSGKPIIGILAEYEGLPGLSQKAIPTRETRPGITSGHGCGHNLFGTASTAAAIAARYALEKHNIKGTIRLYGCPAEEICVGKVYMARAGLFDDCDAVLHWHPKYKTYTGYGSCKAMTSVRFTFKGLSAHAAMSPEGGKSALDAVELMNIGVNFLREHTTEDTRMHYVITNGGKAPNVVPPITEVWYYVRADKHSDMLDVFGRVLNIAKGAALMTDTTVEWKFDTDCWELLPNWPLSQLIEKNLQIVGPPKFSQSEKDFAQKTRKDLKTKSELALYDKIDPLTEDFKTGKGSTDVGNVSWIVPTSGVSTACYTNEAPGHSWQIVACSGMSIGEKGMMVATRTLAYSAVELFTDHSWITKAKADFDKRRAGEEITSLIPKGQKPPIPTK